MAGDRCLVLGGSGFLGSHLVELLEKEGIPVRVYSRSATSSIRLVPLADRVELRAGDFRAEKSLADAVRGCQYVYHLIGTTVPAASNRDPVFDTEINLLPTLRLLQVCAQEKVRQVIFASSGGTVYGNTDGQPIPETHSAEPLSSYAINKLTVERYLDLYFRLHGLDYTVLRIGNAYGPRLPLTGGQGVIGTVLARLGRGEPISVWGDGSVTRDYVYVGDVASALRAALGQRSPFRIFNVGTGVGTSLLELIAKIERVVGHRGNIVKEPAREVDVAVNILDTTRARKYLGWEAKTSLEAGLAKTWDWVRVEQDRLASVSAKELEEV